MDFHPLFWAACRAGSTNVVRELLREGAPYQIDFSKANDLDSSALVIAACNGHEDIVNLILEKDPDGHLRKNANDENIFHHLCQTTHTVMIDKFLELGVPVDEVDAGGSTALDFRASALNPHNIGLFAGRNFNFSERRDDNGRTLLHRAADWNKSQEVVADLLAQEVPLDHAANNRDTALHIMCRQGNGQAARTLVDAGASTDIEDAQGETAASIARGKGIGNPLAPWFSTAGGQLGLGMSTAGSIAGFSIAVAASVALGLSATGVGAVIGVGLVVAIAAWALLALIVRAVEGGCYKPHMEKPADADDGNAENLGNSTSATM